MKKLLALLGVAGMVAMWSGCGLEPASSVDISITSIGAVAAGGAAGQVEGTIEADSIITNVEMTVLNSSGADVKSSFTVSFTSGYSGKEKADLKDDMSTTVGAKSGTAAGTYSLKITASSGSITSSTEKEFTVTSTGTPVTTSTLTIGSYDNASVGSSVDLDAGTVMLAAAATQSGSGVDIVGTYSSSKSAFRIFNPKYAKESSGITAFANWSSPNETQFHKVSVTFASITTKEEIQPLFNASSVPSDGALSCAAGDVLVVKTDQSAYVLVELTSFDANATGTANIKYGK